MLEVAKEVMGITGYQKYVPATWDRKIREFFGAPLVVIVDLWNRIGPVKRQTLDAKPKHLLWALVFLHVYSTEEIHCRIIGTKDPKLYREWTWFMIERIAMLKEEIIRLDRRFENANEGATCLLTVDGTDVPVMEPWPFDSKWFSKKFNGPAVKYEVGVSIYNGFTCWINGPFVASTNDSTIFFGSQPSEPSVSPHWK